MAKRVRRKLEDTTWYDSLNNRIINVISKCTGVSGIIWWYCASSDLDEDGDTVDSYYNMFSQDQIESMQEVISL